MGLTLINSVGKMATVSKTLRVRPSNSRPLMPQDQFFIVQQGQTLSFNLEPAVDGEDNPLTYSLISGLATG